MSLERGDTSMVGACVRAAEQVPSSLADIDEDTLQALPADVRAELEAHYARVSHL
jgi:hypothetical protein